MFLLLRFQDWGRMQLIVVPRTVITIVGGDAYWLGRMTGFGSYS